ncbi:MAG: hypothetical protein ACFCBW_02885 [Candidatus Competibacterales bacterium]
MRLSDEFFKILVLPVGDRAEIIVYHKSTDVEVRAVCQWSELGLDIENCKTRIIDQILGGPKHIRWNLARTCNGDSLWVEHLASGAMTRSRLTKNAPKNIKEIMLDELMIKVNRVDGGTDAILYAYVGPSEKSSVMPCRVVGPTDASR